MIDTEKAQINSEGYLDKIVTILLVQMFLRHPANISYIYSCRHPDLIPNNYSGRHPATN
jgi:hypothetical protein